MQAAKEREREKERESSSFRSFCRCFASIAFSSSATAPEGSFFILPLFEIRRTLLLSGPTREERETLSDETEPEVRPALISTGGRFIN